MTGQSELRNPQGEGPFLLVCEHASNAFPDRFGTLGLDSAARSAHIAWDPGALPVARALSDLLDSPLVAATVSRLVYDCNRPPDAPGAMPETSEIYDIPGNRGLDAARRLARTEAVYLPFQGAVAAQLARMLAQGERRDDAGSGAGATAGDAAPAARRPVLVTVHSFTPVWFGQRREVEFGIIHDRDPGFSQAVLEAARPTGLRAALNQPYSGADGVAHTLRLHATPHDLPHAMLEIRNDLIADAAAQTAMAGLLAGVLTRALAATQQGRAA